MKKFLLIGLWLVFTAFVSGVTAYFVTRSQANIKFVSEPRANSPDYGYLQVNGKGYYQLETTTEIEDNSVPPGTHYHRIDLRGER